MICRSGHGQSRDQTGRSGVFARRGAHNSRSIDSFRSGKLSDRPPGGSCKSHRQQKQIWSPRKGDPGGSGATDGRRGNGDLGKERCRMTSARTTARCHCIAWTALLTVAISISTLGPSFVAAQPIGSGPSPAVSPGSAIGSVPSVTPGAAPSVTPGAAPSVTPGAAPSVPPGAAPSVTPGSVPSVTPGSVPSVTPGSAPSLPPASASSPTIPEPPSGSPSTPSDPGPPPPPVPPVPAPPSGSGKSGLSGGAKAGVAFGVIFGVAALGGGFWVYKQRRNNIGRARQPYADSML